MRPIHQIKGSGQREGKQIRSFDCWAWGDEAPVCPESPPTPLGGNAGHAQKNVAVQGRLLFLPNELIISCQKDRKAIKCQVNFLKHIIFIAAVSA